MEGKTAATIRAEFGATWDIWKDGCVGGESAQEMSDRCDRVRLAPRAVRRHRSRLRADANSVARSLHLYR